MRLSFFRDAGSNDLCAGLSLRLWAAANVEHGHVADAEVKAWMRRPSGEMQRNRLDEKVVQGERSSRNIRGNPPVSG